MELLGKAMTPEFWEQVRTSEIYRPYREELLRLWQENCDQPIPVLKYSEFRLYGVTGDRSVFQKPYYHRRRALNAAALLSLLYPEEEKYLIYLMDVIFAICDEYTWVIPAHQPNLLTKNKNDHLDLFACETGYALSEIYTLLSDRLEEVIRDRIRAEVDRRIITPIMRGDKHGWMRSTNNWNAVCSGSVGCTFMLMRPDLLPAIKAQLDESMECYLKGFQDDGICAEGFHYWHYGFGFFTTYADMIRRFTEGETDYFKREKVRQVAMFVQRMYLSGGATVSFSDSGQTTYHLGILHYLKDQFPDDIEIPPIEYAYNQDSCGRWCWHLRAALWLNPEYLKPQPQREATTYYAADTQWLIRKTPRYGFAIKAGNNNEPHNHNDVGSLIFSVGGKKQFTDLGSGQYSKQFFHPDTRYTFVQCSSRGHSVPIIGGAYQKTGAQYAACDVSYSDEIFSADLAGAYGIEALKHAVRTVSFTEDAVILKDCFDYAGDGAIVDRFACTVQPVAQGGGKVAVGETLLTFSPEECDLSIDSEDANGRPVYFIDLTLKPKVTEANVTISVI